MEKWVKEWKTELQAIGISLFATVVFGIIFFLYLISRNGPYDTWTDLGIFPVCFFCTFFFVIMFLVVLFLLSIRNNRKKHDL